MSDSIPKIRSVLVVDDEEDIRDVLLWTLIDNGYQVATADNGTRALEMLRSGCFDVLVTDLRLPDISGIEILQRIRALGLEILIVAISAYAGCLDRSRLRSLGARELLSKPFAVSAILQEVHETPGRCAYELRFPSVQLSESEGVS